MAAADSRRRRWSAEAAALSASGERTQIFVGNDTIMKLADTDIGFTDFHVGDRITISGTPKGGKGDVDAVTITRSFQ